MVNQTRQNVEPATNSWINQIRTLAETATDLEDLRDKLLTAYPAMSLEQYASALAEASSAANLAGRDAAKAEG
jgi:phage gp29-like protein